MRIRGKIRANSTSKIKKITAIKKKFKEKGSREEVLGSNPHSNGLLFSRSEKVFLDDKFKIINISNKIRKIILEVIVIFRIIYTSNVLDFLIGSQI